MTNSVSNLDITTKEVKVDNIQKLKDKEKFEATDHSEFDFEERLVHSDNNSGEWLWGLGLIALGLVLFFRPFGGLFLHNWWALFIFIPGLIKLFKGIQGNQDQLAAGFFMTLIGAIFLFGLSWGLMWPFFLILGGICAISGAVKSR